MIATSYFATRDLPSLETALNQPNALHSPFPPAFPRSRILWTALQLH
jgi:hypothetical protein